MLWLIPRYSQINHSFKKDLITFRRKLFFLLKYSWFTIFCQFQVYSIVIQNFCRLYPIIDYYKILVYIWRKQIFFSWSKFSFFRKEGCCAFFLTRTQGEEKIGKWRLEPNLRMLQRRQSKICRRKRVIWSLMCASHPVSPLVLFRICLIRNPFQF